MYKLFLNTGPNAISVSLSPKNTMAMVGLAAKRLSWVITSSQVINNRSDLAIRDSFVLWKPCKTIAIHCDCEGHIKM